MTVMVMDEMVFAEKVPSELGKTGNDILLYPSNLCYKERLTKGLTKDLNYMLDCRFSFNVLFSISR